MFKAFGQLWSMVCQFCLAGEKIANSAVLLAEVAELHAEILKKETAEELNKEKEA